MNTFLLDYICVLSFDWNVKVYSCIPTSCAINFNLVYDISMIQFVLFPKKHWVLMAMQHDILQFLRTAVVPLNSLHQWLRLLFLYICLNSHSLSHSWHTCTQAHLHSDVLSLWLAQWFPACWNFFSPSTSVQITSPCGFNPLFFFFALLKLENVCVQTDTVSVSCCSFE